MSDGGQYSPDSHRFLVRENIRQGTELSVAYLLMNVLAAMIASYGLFANSPAVVIGAMIVAMLLEPITISAASARHRGFRR